MARSDVRLGCYEKAMPSNWTWVNKCVAAKDAGYDFIEISIDETDEKLARLDDSNFASTVLNAVKLTGMPIRTMCLSGHRKYPLGSEHPETVIRSLDIFTKAVKLAECLGIRIIQLAGYDVYYEDSSPITRKRFLENLKKCVAIAARHGVLLGFETMETPFMDTVSKAMAVVRAVDSPYLNVYPDLGNCTNAAKLYRTELVDDLHSGQGRIVAVHIKETVVGKYREIPFGKGHVDFKNALKTCMDLGVRMYVAEFWYDSTTEANDVLKSNHDFLTAYFND
ncbi:MAG: L-ribulose-5-phosphate 4-epimerase [Firmicutes bacterium GWF2_51_9]|nr:MAG: L-ribulose-5-phosphate 4-epimerase [Firmicutes bacterium GWF2_51_9]OGS57632.1 MAG: L-ribulose-5-phosphate 4-epimerase [Firmicutes bacterium GWE2_51_13]HAM62222.1 L-ribulose-5-phosphate 4-epimerase [Erysipelotrichaceae bacterium]HAO62256.1 L-ribulose-5-phosphate 4-epimerase [Erysipelotrichaceae bacterium]HBZ42013.1 L-ribulose-5-phosphate 4-epimerase [Erysipelotrichaceae bacterium]